MAKRLNERFIHNMLTNRPFVISKTAITLDGKIATVTGHSQWITSEPARHDVHLLRNEVDGILVGVGTVLADNPSLTTRLQSGKGSNPTRVILDRSLRTPLDFNVCDTSMAPTIIVTEQTDAVKIAAYEAVGVKMVQADLMDLKTVLELLYKEGITDLIVEGGGKVNAAFLQEQLFDKFIVYIAPKILGGSKSIGPFTGINLQSMTDAMPLIFDSVEAFGPDLRITAYPQKDV